LFVCLFVEEEKTAAGVITTYERDGASGEASDRPKTAAVPWVDHRGEYKSDEKNKRRTWKCLCGGRPA